MIDRPEGRVLPKLVAKRRGDTVRALAGTSASMSATRHTPYSLKKAVLRIRILLSLSKNSKKNLDFYCFVTSFLLFTFEK